MAWTAPRTWTTGEVVTAAVMNTHVRDNLNAVTRPLAQSGTGVDVVNTAAETSLWSTSIGANVLGSHGGVLLRLIGSYLNNSGAARTFTLRIKFGATTIFDDGSASIAASPTTRPWSLTLTLANLAATNSQWMGATFRFGILGTTTAGLGDAGADLTLDTELGGSSAIDTTSAATLDVTVQHSAANANLSMATKHASLLYLPI